MGFFGWLLDIFFPDDENNDKTENETVDENAITYTVKDSLITPNEKEFYTAICKAVNPERFVVLPQINLATIIKKTVENKENVRQNELFRNIDFVIFNKENLKPLLCIEINDNTHNTAKRRYRDYKVKDICEKAKMPLIRFWTSYGVNQDYINKTIQANLSKK